jgi:formylglycine-generating enzyme required for sulfatase activity
MSLRKRGVLHTLLIVSAILPAFGAEPANDMVLIPPGEYRMGTAESSDGLADEHPERLVFLHAFFLDRFEVTNQDYAAFVQSTGHRPPANSNPASTVWNDTTYPQYPQAIAKHPVVNVSWEDAAAYCRWSGKRLPTEAEWEKAAR